MAFFNPKLRAARQTTLIPKTNTTVNFDGTVWHVQSENQYSLIAHKDGRDVFIPTPFNKVFAFIDGYAVTMQIIGEEKKYGLIELIGNTYNQVLPCKFDGIEVDNFVAYVKIGGQSTQLTLHGAAGTLAKSYSSADDLIAAAGV